MCGRYTITVDRSAIEYHFNAKFATARQEFEPNYNAVPSQLLPIITTYAPTQITSSEFSA